MPDLNVFFLKENGEPFYTQAPVLPLYLLHWPDLTIQLSQFLPEQKKPYYKKNYRKFCCFRQRK